MPMTKTMRPKAPAASAPAVKAFAIAGGEVAVVQAAAEEGKPKKRPTFSMVAYHGGPMRVAMAYYPVVIDLKGLRSSQQTTVLLDHDRTQIVGQATKTEITANQVRLEGVITGDDEPAKKVLMHAANGFKWASSVGVLVDEYQFIGEKESVLVNGRSVKGPVWVARSGRLGETSFVGVGADEKASSKVAAAAMEIMAMTFEEWLKANGFDAAQITDQQRTTLEAAWKRDQAVAAGGGVDDDDPADPDDEERQPAPKPKKPKAKGKPKRAARAAADDDGDDPDDVVARMREDGATEFERQEKLRQLCGGRHPELLAKAIREGWTVDRTELEVLRASSPPVSGVRRDDRAGGPARHRIIEAALARNYNLVREDRLGKHYDEKTVEAALGRDGRRVSLHALLYEVCAAAGIHVSPGHVDADLIRAAFSADRQLTASGGFSSVSLSGVLSNVANKAMIEMYLLAASVVGDIAWETDAPNFKEYTRYRLDGNGSLSEVGATGELKHVQVQETAYSNRLKTYGGLLTLTRQMMIDDDLGAFMQIPQIFGELAAVVKEQMVIAAILANAGSFFGSGNANYFDGSDSALSIGALETAEQKFLEMKNANGHFIRRIPDRLLVPPALKALAQRLFVSDVLLATTTANKPLGATNTYKGSFRPVVSPYLGTASGLSGASNTGWYMLGQPSPTGAIVQVGYLRGQRFPIIESGEVDFNKLGMSWRSYYDFGVGLFDPKAGVFSKGTT